MKKILGGIIAALALAVVTIAPKVMATNEAHLSGDSRKSIRIVHKVTHYSGETHADTQIIRRKSAATLRASVALASSAQTREEKRPLSARLA